MSVISKIAVKALYSAVAAISLILGGMAGHALFSSLEGVEVASVQPYGTVVFSVLFVPPAAISEEKEVVIKEFCQGQGITYSMSNGNIRFVGKSADLKAIADYIFNRTDSL
jgi:hypothetical protein